MFSSLFLIARSLLVIRHTGCSFCLFSSEYIFLQDERTCHVRFVFARSLTVIKHKVSKLLYCILLENTRNNHFFLRFYKLCNIWQTETVTHTADLQVRTEIIANFRNHNSFNNL